MGLNNVMLVSQITGHIVALVLSFCVIFPMILHNSKFKYEIVSNCVRSSSIIIPIYLPSSNHCMLFMDGVWTEEDGLYHIRSTNAIYCDFPIFTAFFVVTVSLVQIIRFSRLAYRKEEAKFLGLFLDVCFSTIMFVMTIISALFITLGFIRFCKDMTKSFQTCGEAAGQNITEDAVGIDTSGFYVDMGSAQFGIWGAFAACVIVAVVAYLKMINEHQMQNMKVRLYMDRQRLVHEETSSLADSLNAMPSSPNSTSMSTVPTTNVGIDGAPEA